MQDVQPHCLNCEAPMANGWRFCAQCGQRTDTARMSFRDMMRDLNYSFAHVERGPLAFAWALLIRPGQVARAYVEGKRRRYFGPFATLLIVVGFTAVVINLLAFEVTANDNLPQAAARVLRQHFNFVLLAQLPLLGLVCSLIFREARMRLVEHMVLVSYALTVRAAFLALSAPAVYLTTHSTPSATITYVYWIAWCAYFGWACSQFYTGRRWIVWAQGAAAAAIGGVTVMAGLNVLSKAVLALAAGR